MKYQKINNKAITLIEEIMLNHYEPMIELEDLYKRCSHKIVKRDFKEAINFLNRRKFIKTKNGMVLLI